MSATIEVLTPGLQTTVQDRGRWGHQTDGVSVAGPMDPFAHRRANAFVGNARDAATLEVAITGPDVRFDGACTCAVTGAEFELQVDGTPMPGEASFDVPEGAVLHFGARRSGARAYLAVAGGFDVPRVLGSRATHVPTAMGGWHGRALVRGDRLPLAPPSTRGAACRAAPQVRGMSALPVVVRVLPGPQDDRFMPEALDALVSSAYVVGIDSDRMGFRLSGVALSHRASADIISDATPLGSIQVPASGQAVLLMADRQTTGGYAKLATVISADIGVAAQAAPGDEIWFRVCTRAEAVAALIARERELLALGEASA
jgi:antagonist of KipI